MIKKLLLLLFLISTMCFSSPITTTYSTIDYTLSNITTAPGDDNYIVFNLTHLPKWPSYWKNPGESGLKTRNFDTIKQEIEYFFNIHQQQGTIPGGVHFELTGDNVTECTGGIKNIQDNDLTEHYQTACDPRLNNEQSLEMGFLIAELLQKRRIASE